MVRNIKSGEKAFVLLRAKTINRYLYYLRNSFLYKYNIARCAFVYRFTMRLIFIGVNLFILFFISLSCCAQPDWTKVHFGVSGAAGFKAKLVSSEGQRVDPWGNINLSAVSVVDGAEEESLKFYTKLGVTFDFEQYIKNDFLGFDLDRTLLHINPGVLLPLQIAGKRPMVGLGIGTDIHLGSRLWVDGINSSTITETYYTGNLSNKERKIIPFVNASILFKVRKRIVLQTDVRQMLTSYYYKDEIMDFGDKLQPKIIKLHHQPTYFSFSVWYMFG